MSIFAIATYCILWYFDLIPCYDGACDLLPFLLLKGGGASNQTVEKNLVPDWAQDEVEEFLTQANTLYSEGFAAYTGTTYAPQPQNEIDGIAAIANISLASPHAIVTSGEALLNAVIGGTKLNFNPKLDGEFSKKAEALIQEFLEITLPNINNTYAMIGNYGSDSHHAKQRLAARKLYDAFSDIGVSVYYADYKQEWDLGISSIPAIRSYANQEAIDAEKLRWAGILDREYRQGSLEDLFKKDKDEKEQELKKHAFLLEATKTLIGAGSKTVTPYYRPNAMSAIAGVATSTFGAYMFDKLTMKDTPMEGAQIRTGFERYDVMRNPNYLNTGLLERFSTQYPMISGG